MMASRYLYNSIEDRETIHENEGDKCHSGLGLLNKLKRLRFILVAILFFVFVILFGLIFGGKTGYLMHDYL